MKPASGSRRRGRQVGLALLVGIGAGCLGPTEGPPITQVRSPAISDGRQVESPAHLEIQVPPHGRWVSEVPAGWQSMRVTLTNPGRLTAPLVRVVNQAGGTGVRTIFSKLRPGGDYTVVVELFTGTDASGTLVASGVQGNLTLAPGSNTVSLLMSSATTRLDALPDVLFACGSLVTVTGNFLPPSTVTFQPSGVTTPLNITSTTQGSFEVPCTATPGTVTVSGPGGTSEARSIRIATYVPSLVRPFTRHYDQTLLARTAPRLVTARRHAGVLLHGSQVLVLGGSTGLTTHHTIEQALVNADATLMTFRAMNRTLNTPREGAVWIDHGERVTAVGGANGNQALSTTESAAWQTDDTPGTFENGRPLVQARAHGAGVVIGGSLYVLGGESNGIPLDSVERAPIDGHGVLTGPFQTVPGVKLTTPRSRAIAFQRGGRLYLAGGRGAGGPLSTVESTPVSANGDLGAFAPSDLQLTVPREGATSMILGNEWLVMGGRTTGQTLLDTTERALLDEAGPGAFTPVAGITLDTAREGAGAVLVGDQLHLVGGTGSTGDLTRTEFASTNGSGQLGAFVAGSTTFTPRFGNGAAVLGTGVHVFGGCGGGITSTGGCSSDGAILDTVQRARAAPDGTLGTFTTTGRLDIGRFNFTPAILGTNLWVLAGGLPSTAPGKTPKVIRAPISTTGAIGSFVDGDRTVARVSGANAVALGLNVYAIGGTDQNGTISTTRAGTLAPGTFSLTSFGNDGPRLVTPRARAGLVVLGNRVLVVGGQSDRQGTALGSIESCAIDPATDQLTGNFTRLTQGLVVPRVAPALVVAGTRLYVIGGTQGTGWTGLPSVEWAPLAMDGSPGAFTLLSDPALGKSRGLAAAATAGNALHLFGGLDRGLPLGTTERATLR